MYQPLGSERRARYSKKPNTAPPPSAELHPAFPGPPPPAGGRVLTPDIKAQVRLPTRRGEACPRPPLPLRRNIEFQPTPPPVGRGQS